MSIMPPGSENKDHHPRAFSREHLDMERAAAIRWAANDVHMPYETRMALHNRADRIGEFCPATGRYCGVSCPGHDIGPNACEPSTGGAV